jgi:ActR/RegA family two-component response regulator
MREAAPNCVIIMLTGYPDMESAEEGISLGIDDYIAKPADANLLVALLADRLAAREARDSTYVDSK